MGSIKRCARPGWPVLASRTGPGLNGRVGAWGAVGSGESAVRGIAGTFCDEITMPTPIFLLGDVRNDVNEMVLRYGTIWQGRMAVKAVELRERDTRTATRSSGLESPSPDRQDQIIKAGSSPAID